MLREVKRNFVFRKVPALLFACLMVLTACSSSPGTGDGNDNQKPRAGGNLVILHNETVAPDLKKLTNVLLGAAYPVTQIMQPLTLVNEEGTVEPLLAESLEQSEDGSTWTIKLRDAKFSDGTPVTSEDVKFTLLDLQRDISLYRYLFESIDSVDTPDEKTAVVNMSQPDAFLPEALSLYCAGIIPKDWGGKTEEAFYDAPVGAGPFMLTGEKQDWVRGQTIRLVKNPEYWQPERPYLDSVTFKTVSDENQRILQLKGGQANVSTFPQPSQATVALEDSPEVNVKNLPAYLMTLLMLNQKYEPLTDQHLRKAIAMSVDRESIVKAIMFGRGSPDTSYLPTRIAYHQPQPSIDFNLDEAKKELAASNYPDGLDLKLLVSAGAATELAIAQIMQQNLAELNIAIEIEQLDVSAKIQKEQAGTHEMVIQGYGMVTGTPAELTGFLTDPAVAGCFFQSCTDEELAQMGKTAATAVGESEQEAAYADVQRAFAESSVIVPIVNPFTPLVTSSNVRGFRFGLGYGMFVADTWMSN